MDDNTAVVDIATPTRYIDAMEELPTLHVRVPAEFLDEVKSAAKAEQLTLSAFVRRTLAARINEMRARGELRN